MNGILLVKKETGYTSRDVVNIVGKALKTRKVGHTGTLDPMAEGLLVLCVGKGTKLVEVLTHEEKEYEAEVVLGILTDTLDKEGTILKVEKALFKEEQIHKVLDSFKGTYEQEVPSYSAVKINGKKLYEYAREGKNIELPKRMVEIKKIELIGSIRIEEEKTIFQIRVTVSKGTYIRSLIRDIAQRLGTIGTMTKLLRTKVGTYELKDAYDLEQIKNQTFQLISLEESTKDYLKVVVSGELEKQIKNGMVLENRYQNSRIAFYNESEKLLALYREYEKDKTKIKPWKMF